MGGTDGPGAAAQLSYLAGGMYERFTWVRMMAESFKEADVQRTQLVQNGPWTARTDSIARFSRFETYA